MRCPNVKGFALWWNMTFTFTCLPSKAPSTGDLGHILFITCFAECSHTATFSTIMSLPFKVIRPCPHEEMSVTARSVATAIPPIKVGGFYVGMVPFPCCVFPCVAKSRPVVLITPVITEELQDISEY